MGSLVVNLLLLAFHFWFATERYKEKKYLAAMIHSCSIGIHFTFFL